MVTFQTNKLKRKFVKIFKVDLCQSNVFLQEESTQLTFTRSKSTIETLEKDVKYFVVVDVVPVFLLLTLKIFHILSFSSVSTVDFEHVNVSWVSTIRHLMKYDKVRSSHRRCSFKKGALQLFQKGDSRTGVFL